MCINNFNCISNLLNTYIHKFSYCHDKRVSIINYIRIYGRRYNRILSKTGHRSKPHTYIYQLRIHLFKIT
jgi:hypothetical protein